MSIASLNAELEDIDTRIHSLEWIGGDEAEYNELLVKREDINTVLDDNFLGNLF
jgi:hypothetical protein